MRRIITEHKGVKNLPKVVLQQFIVRQFFINSISLCATTWRKAKRRGRLQNGATKATVSPSQKTLSAVSAMHNKLPVKSRKTSRELASISDLVMYLLKENGRACFCSVSVVTSTAAANKHNNSRLMQYARSCLFTGRPCQ